MLSPRRLLCGILLGALLISGAPLAARTKGSSQLAFGVKMAQRGLWSEALFRFLQAERLDPGNPRILNNIAVAYEAVGNFEAALENYRKALEADPDNRDLRRNYARFVEFYQSYTATPSAPVPEEGAERAETEGSDEPGGGG